jgi:hypothetical protein
LDSSAKYSSQLTHLFPPFSRYKKSPAFLPGCRSSVRNIVINIIPTYQTPSLVYITTIFIVHFYPFTFHLSLLPFHLPISYIIPQFTFHLSLLPFHLSVKCQPHSRNTGRKVEEQPNLSAHVIFGAQVAVEKQRAGASRNACITEIPVIPYHLVIHKTKRCR